VPQIRLINEKGEMVGVKTIQEALKLADDTGYDLIEIAPTAVPPVCKLGNFSKFLYEQEKKSKEAKKHRGAGQIKEIRFRTKIGEHDFMTKVNQINRFLKERHKVRVSMIFYGREMEHRELGLQMVDRIEQSISPVGVIEQRPQMYGNRMISILVPK
jgi:translation initiation factor IF-3